MSQPASSTLQSFDPFALHPFTSGASATPPAAGSSHVGIPVAAYPSHVLSASTSPGRSPAANSSLSSQSTSPPSKTNGSAAPVQSPQPRPLGQAQPPWATSTRAAASSSSQSSGRNPNAIFEHFKYERSSPDLDELPLAKRSTNAWGTKELEESFSKK